jgi:hypothetical protein
MPYKNVCLRVFYVLTSFPQTVACGPLVIQGGPQAVSEETALQKLYQALNERKIHQYMPVLELPLLVDLQQKVGELVPFHNFLQ